MAGDENPADVPVQRRTNSDIYLLIEEVRNEARMDAIKIKNQVSILDAKINNHLKFHEGVLLAAKELGEKRIKWITVTIMACTCILSGIGLIIGVLI